MKRVLAILALLALATPALAATVFVDDFEDGDADGWASNVRVSGAAFETAIGPRTALSLQVLTGTDANVGRAPMAAYAPAAGATAPRSTFNGTLRFEGAMSSFTLHRDLFNSDADPSLRLRELPRFAVALTQDGDALIPLVRGPITSGHPNWDYAIGVGRAWNEAADGGKTRAALPFTLIEVNANCTHNGVLTFLFDNAGHVSKLAWQVASETCAYLQFDASGLAIAGYEPRPAALGAEARAAFARERAALMPTRALSQLARDFPGVDLSGFASPADVNPAALSTFGVVYNGVHYLGDCDTRAGPYPFCEQLLLPSYSLAKSISGGLGLMRLELLHPGAMNQRIADHVDPCANWNDVTLANALDMATGRYDSPDDQADENNLTSSRFFLSTTHAEKAQIACSLYPRRQAPEQRWVYHTPDTYALGAAMSDLWREAHGANADVFNDVLVEGVYRPLNLSPEIAATRRTLDGARQPFFGWGLTLTRDDIAKLGAYLTALSHETSLIDPRQLNAAMQRDPNDPGLRAGGDLLRYNNGFWAYNAQGPLNCPAPVWIPFLSGYGGNIVALMPNGVTYYHFSDGYDIYWARAVVAANAIAPLCARVSQ